MFRLLKSVAVLGVVITLFTHVSHVITWPNWLHAMLLNWRELFTDFWGATASLIGLDISIHTARLLTVCAFMLLAITCASREEGISTKTTKLGLAVAIAGLTVSAMLIVGALMIPIVSDRTLPQASTAYRISNLIIACVGLVILLFVMVKQARLRDLAHQAWIFLALFALMACIFMGHIIVHVMEVMSMAPSLVANSVNACKPINLQDCALATLKCSVGSSIICWQPTPVSSSVTKVQFFPS